MKKIKDLLKIKLLLPSVIAILLISSGIAYAINKKSQQEEEARLSEFYHPFFSDDIFADMEAMEKQMNQAFDEHRKLMKKMFSNVEKRQKSKKSSNSLQLHEDEKSYKYELKFSDFSKDDVIISVNDRILTISAQKESSSKDKSYSGASLYYSLSIPSNAQSKPDIERKSDKIVISFKKEE